ncbi:50S ribosomal protein L11 methyltransferase [Pedobacter sp. MC2016-14]|uniref:50S ribosomal protein L11 methyltransferase n=1 Tax=Pedobacter sp. MC2016-14 TaxID=2897327 RepID=UPI001E4D15D4|nr:50S ribosomal protein L11 methyltransferase [Pedobacter sp. MC2016-14]MCD0490678.1 50S ribosomal protein L11 methyltransferase [Pedobacter sp. MC2016-14]
MKYIQVAFIFTAIADYQQDLLINELAEIGFDTFEDTEAGFDAFIQADQFQIEQLDVVLVSLKEELDFSYLIKEVADENWNKEWEKNFEPLIISDQCYVRATFHQPQDKYPYQIIIDPKMAFGTGHHQTTTMMMEYILETDFQQKIVLDMGCGTGILAILAAMKGARDLTAIDYDDVCYESTKENMQLNNCTYIKAICGGKEVIPSERYDVILANINRNILLDQIQTYAEVLRTDGSIYFSGFYEYPDLDMIRDACRDFGINYVSHKKNGDWVAAHFKMS